MELQGSDVEPSEDEQEVKPTRIYSKVCCDFILLALTDHVVVGCSGLYSESWHKERPTVEGRRHSRPAQCHQAFEDPPQEIHPR